MDILVSILNYQPFGDHGVMNILSIRVIHILMIWVTWKIIPSWKEFKESW